MRLGVDVGTVRVGVARSDPSGMLASPVATLPSAEAIGRLAELVREHDVVGVIVGLPVTLAGREGTSAVLAREFAEKLTEVISPIPVELTDERLTTVAAERRLTARGVRGRARRAVVDQAAAVEILQCWLDTSRTQSDGPA